MATLAFHDPVLEAGFREYHAQRGARVDLPFCAWGTLIWALTFIRMPSEAPFSQRLLVGAAVLSTLMPWALGPRRWTRHREGLVFALRFLRTAALQGQFHPKDGTALSKSPPGLLKAVLVSKCLQLLMFSVFFRLRFPNHLVLQALSLAIGWHLNRRICSGWEGLSSGTSASFDQAGGRKALYSGAILSCNKYIGTEFDPSHGCALTLGGLQLIVGVIAPSVWVFVQERKSRREYAGLCGVEDAFAAEEAGHKGWRSRFGFTAVAVLVGASLCWQLLEAYERLL